MSPACPPPSPRPARSSHFEAVANTALNDGAIIVNPAEADFDEIVGILKEVWA